MHVVDRVGAIGERPEDRVGVGGSMSSLTAMQILPQSASSVEAPCSARQTSVRGMPCANCTNITLRRLVSGSCITTLRTPLIDEPVAQMREEHRLVGDLLDHARFARRHLADDRDEHRRALAGDRGHLHRHVEVFERDVAVALAERPFRLEQFGIDQALDHDLGVGRHVEIDADAFRHADRRAGEPARDRHLVEIDRRASSAR